MPAVYMLSGLVIGCLGFQLAIGPRKFDHADASLRMSSRTSAMSRMLLSVVLALSLAWWLGAIAALLGRC